MKNFWFLNKIIVYYFSLDLLELIPGKKETLGPTKFNWSHARAFATGGLQIVISQVGVILVVDTTSQEKSWKEGLKNAKVILTNSREFLENSFNF